jgi:hypothetical protein
MSSDFSSSPAASDSLKQIERIYRIYEALAATSPFHAEYGLGGKLFYAGSIDDNGRNLLYAANIAGAASLAAAPDPTLQRHAIRDGVIDFLVTSLEEALRILKNEIRKQQPVSVAVAIEPQLLIEQMLDLGVLPDLLPALSNEGSNAPTEKFVVQGAKLLVDRTPATDEHVAFVAWSVDRNPARWLPRLDACALAILPEADLLRRRWLRLAPRYLGQLARRQHGVALLLEESKQLKSGTESCISQFANEGEESVQVIFQDPF